MKPSDKLALPAAEIRKLGAAAMDFVAEHYESIPSLHVMPQTSSAELKALFEEPLPQAGMDAEALLHLVRTAIAPNLRHHGHPRFFGYVASPGTPICAIGDLLTSALNANVTSWRSAPAATEIEHVCMHWLKQMLGLSESALGLFVSGGSMGNFSALAASGARRVYVTGQSHFSITKAAHLLGITDVVTIPTDARFRMDPDALRQLADQPGFVSANAGAVAMGAFDPLDAIADVAAERKLWIHVDAAYGGFAALALSARPLFKGIERADSVTLDPHKWLYLPPGCGAVLYRDPSAAHRAFAHQADYINVVGHQRDEAFAFWDYGPELSRPFRALNFWLLVKFVGAAALGEAIEENMACARYLEELVRASEDFEMLAPVGLSIFCFRCRPPGFAGDLDRLNEELLIALQRDGSSYLSNARIDGKFALRGCVLNHRTTRRDMEILLEDLRRVARS